MSHTAQPAPAEPELGQVSFVAMGSDIHIVAVGATPDALRRASAAVRMLDHRWSRFRPDSEVSRINAAAGRTTRVSTATTTLVALAVRGWRATDGTYDPTILDALVAAGYDRSFDRIDDADRAHGNAGTPSGPAPGCTGIRDGTERHHLIDPATGAPAATVFVAATGVAGSAWWAEVLTKAVLLADSADAAEWTLSAGGGAALVADRAGRRHRLAGIDRFLR